MTGLQVERAYAAAVGNPKTCDLSLTGMLNKVHDTIGTDFRSRDALNRIIEAIDNIPMDRKKEAELHAGKLEALADTMINENTEALNNAAEFLRDLFR